MHGVVRGTQAADLIGFDPRSERPKPTIIAVIARANLTPGYAHEYTSHRTDGGWYALMGTDREMLIDSALDKAEEFNTSNPYHNPSQYEVWIGTLTEKIVTPPKREYRVVKL